MNHKLLNNRDDFNSYRGANIYMEVPARYPCIVIEYDRFPIKPEHHFIYLEDFFPRDLSIMAITVWKTNEKPTKERVETYRYGNEEDSDILKLDPPMR
jgi:hypothetical protein